MEMHFRISTTADGKTRVDSAIDPHERPGFDSWSHMGDYDTIDEAGQNAGEEVAYQYKRKDVSE